MKYSYTIALYGVAKKRVIFWLVADIFKNHERNEWKFVNLTCSIICWRTHSQFFIQSL